MKVVILCGGQGTRILDVSRDLPKPMIRIGNYPILWHIMKNYAAAGHNEFILCLGHLGEIIKNYFLNYYSLTNDFSLILNKRDSIKFHTSENDIDWHVTLADTGDNTMTGARVKRIQRYVSKEKTFLLTYGDGLANINFPSLINFHQNHGKIMTLTGVRPPGRFGEVIHDDQGKATGFNEKPQTTGGRISGGFFVCQQSIFDWLDQRENLILEQEPMNKLVNASELMVYRHEGFWQCMDTARDYRLLNSMWANENAPWKNW